MNAEQEAGALPVFLQCPPLGAMPLFFCELWVPCLCLAAAEPARALPSAAARERSPAQQRFGTLRHLSCQERYCVTDLPGSPFATLACSRVLWPALCMVPHPTTYLFPTALGTAVAWPFLVLPSTWPSEKQWFEVFQNSLVTWVLLSFSTRRSEVYWITEIRHPVAKKTVILLMTGPTGLKLHLTINTRSKELSCSCNTAGMSVVSIYALPLNENWI